MLRHPATGPAFTTQTFHDLTIVFGMLPWWQTPALASFRLSAHGLCYLPFQGWQDGVWHDGPLVRLNGAGEVLALVTLGGAAQLTTPLAGGAGVDVHVCHAWLEDADGEGAKISLAEALLARHGDLKAAELRLGRRDDRDAALCVLMRVAYPAADLVCRDQNLSPPWRRLLQNLGILHGRAPFPRDPLAPVPLEALRDVLPAHRIAGLLQALQRISQVIPPRLLHETKNGQEPSRAMDCARDD